MTAKRLLEPRSPGFLFGIRCQLRIQAWLTSSAGDDRISLGLSDTCPASAQRRGRHHREGGCRTNL